ncbi:hypothetical protein [Rhodococcus triatomae]
MKRTRGSLRVAGFVVVATDYVGLGTDGVHGIGTVAARAPR